MRYLLITLLICGLLPLSAFAARTDSPWQERLGTYLETAWNEGRDILINGVSKYLNFGSISGSSGYGFRDNAGEMEYKDSGGSWSPFNAISGGSGGASSSVIQIDGSTQNTGVPTLDFDGTDFDITESPSDDFDISVADELALDLIDFNGTSSVSYLAGRLYHNDVINALEYHDEYSDTEAQIPYENWVQVYNTTGSTLNNCEVVYESGATAWGTPLVSLADASSPGSARFLGVVTNGNGIANNATGTVTWFGEVNGCDTSSLTAGNVGWLATTTPGTLTSVRPKDPYFAVPVGTISVSDASNGKFIVRGAQDNGGIERVSSAFFAGTTITDPTISVTSNGSTITLSLEQTGGGDLYVILDEQVTKLDTSPATTTSLTAGSDTSPQINYAYIPLSTLTLTANTTGFPTSEQYVPVATFLCPSAALTASDGCYKEHQWSDHLSTSVGQGLLSDLNLWIRNQNATWNSGVSPTATGGANTFDIETTAGVVLQLHPHTFPARNTASGDSLYIVNDPSTSYQEVTDLTQEVTDSNGVSMSNKSYNIVLWGVANEVASTSKLMINLPAASYNTGAQATDDANRTANYTIPQAFKGVGFLIARIVVSNSGGSGGTFTIEDTIDLRGQSPSLFAGGVAGSQTEFEDNVFRILDNTDSTKKVAFEVSGLTTATTRNLTVQDSDGTLALTSDLHNPVTLAGEDYLSLSTQQITANAINPDNLSASDFGEFTCNGTNCSLDDSVAVSSWNLTTPTFTTNFTFDSVTITGLSGIDTEVITGTLDTTNAVLTVDANDDLVEQGLTWNVTAGTCTGDGNGGVLTVNGSNQIICDTDDGGGGSVSGGWATTTDSNGPLTYTSNNVGIGGNSPTTTTFYHNTDTGETSFGSSTSGTTTITDNNDTGFVFQTDSGNGIFWYLAEAGKAVLGAIGGAITELQTSLQLTLTGGIHASSTASMWQADSNDLVHRLFENSGGEYYDIQVDSSGDLNFVTDGGTTAFSALDTGNIEMAGGMYHIDDVDTYIQFLTDNMFFTAGGLTFLDFTESTNDIATALGEWDFGGATSVEIPNGSDPTLNATGTIAVVDQLSTTSLRFFDGLTEYQLKPEFSLFSPSFSSSSLAYDGSYGASGTTTEAFYGVKYPVTITELYCRTDKGTAVWQIGDGSASSTALVCDSDGTTSSSPSNNTYTAREAMYNAVGTQSGDPNRIYVEVTTRWTTD